MWWLDLKRCGWYQNINEKGRFGHADNVVIFNSKKETWSVQFSAVLICAGRNKVFQKAEKSFPSEFYEDSTWKKRHNEHFICRKRKVPGFKPWKTRKFTLRNPNVYEPRIQTASQNKKCDSLQYYTETFVPQLPVFYKGISTVSTVLLCRLAKVLQQIVAWLLLTWQAPEMTINLNLNWPPNKNNWAHVSCIIPIEATCSFLALW